MIAIRISTRWRARSPRSASRSGPAAWSSSAIWRSGRRSPPMPSDGLSPAAGSGCGRPGAGADEPDRSDRVGPGSASSDAVGAGIGTPKPVSHGQAPSLAAHRGCRRVRARDGRHGPSGPRASRASAAQPRRSFAACDCPGSGCQHAAGCRCPRRRQGHGAHDAGPAAAAADGARFRLEVQGEGFAPWRTDLLVSRQNPPVAATLAPLVSSVAAESEPASPTSATDRPEVAKRKLGKKGGATTRAPAKVAAAPVGEARLWLKSSGAWVDVYLAGKRSGPRRSRACRCPPAGSSCSS